MAIADDPSLTDAALQSLLQRCAAGDITALSSLHGLTAQRLLAQLRRLLPNRDDAQDALQEVFLRIWQRAALYDPGRGRPLTWMLAIARHHAIDALRARRPTVPLDETLAGQLVDPCETGLPESTRTEVLMRRSFGSLSREQQLCLRLAYVTGQSHEEIARGLGLPLGSVKSWIRRGLMALRERMDPSLGRGPPAASA